LADKSTMLVLDALGRAAAEPQGVPLLGSKSALFPASPLARQAAKRCLDEHYLRVVRTEERGKSVQEYCALTERGLAFLLECAHPRHVLEDLLRAVESRQQQLDAIVSLARATHVDLGELKAITERVLQQMKQDPGNGSPSKNGSTDASRSILDCLRRWNDSGDCPLPELFRQVLSIEPMLTLGTFHDGLRHLHEREQIYLHPWTGPLYDVPEPNFALLVGHEIAYYASFRKDEG
jgi:hypothetical protein